MKGLVIVAMLAVLSAVGCGTTGRANSSETNVRDVAQFFADNGYEGNFTEEPGAILLSGLGIEQMGTYEGKGFRVKIWKYHSSGASAEMARVMNHTSSLLNGNPALFANGLFLIEVVKGDCSGISGAFCRF